MKIPSDVIRCRDCGLPYDKFGIDTFLPREQWVSILKPEEKEIYSKTHIVLCANCMVKRGSKMDGIIGTAMVLQIYEDMRIEIVLEKISKWLSRARLWDILFFFGKV